MSVRGPGPGTGPGGSTTGLNPSGKVWACRNLQSLHLGIHVQRDFPHETKVHSQIVYSYLSIVCPNIRDLRIDPYYQAVLFPRPILFMDLDAGLCLLSRLRYLETLLIGSAGIMTTSGSRDLTWMVASGWTVEARKERKKTMSEWETMLLEETHQWPAATRRTLEGPYVEAGLIGSLQNLGLLEDVKNTLDRMERIPTRGATVGRCFSVFPSIDPLNWVVPPRRNSDAFSQRLGHPSQILYLDQTGSWLINI